tara:strand:- start:7203 stop:7862 length:660 start_codon:yes stop_codon:yes gene_type:complete
METIIKIVIILVLIIIYFMTMKNCIENFAILPYNSKINTTNKSNTLKDRHQIDSIDIDITTNENSYYYEFSNEKYLELLISMFNPSTPEKYIILRNNEWQTEIDSNITAIYNKAYQFISNKIAENTPDIQIVHDLLIQYKKDEEKQEYLLEIDMILYRNYKLNGKHVKFIIYVNHTRERVIDINIKGVVGEDKIGLHPIVPKDTNDYVSFESIDKLIIE